ncbi:xylosyltransferase oxt [Diaphorina citri]|uniref:protein xylosyltransferase n=1 Tax=Diaphorina citri TaxID=121845 RepID=A0A1S3DKW3_DIACI|nr:xylosyltransferase oxt [Diaphorina citri]
MAGRSVDVRWIRRYRVFFIAGGFILVFQIFLAYVFIIISDANDRTTYEYLSGRGNINVENLDEKHRLQNLSVHRFNKEPYLPVEYEESSNSNILSVSNKNKLPPDKLTRLQLEDLDFVPPCDIHVKEAISSIYRAKTQQCKQMIANVTCLIINNQLYPRSLPHLCPTDFIIGKSLGCYEDDGTTRLLNGYSVILKNSNSPQNCISICLQNGYLYAGVQFGSECFCGNDQPTSTARKPDPACNMKCSGNPREACGGYYKMNVYQTGLSKFQPQSALEDEVASISQSAPTVRIAFLLTVNGRALRQVHRLVRALFHRDHFFLIHVDARQDYLFRELLSLELRLPNVRLSRRRQATIWGGASLVTILLDSMQQLLESGWRWDFIVNLSESDYPVKTNRALVDFLSANRDKNFVKSHGRQVHRFISKQGLDKSFVECEARMWRVGDRTLPQGIVMDGGSDWLVLSRSFVSYVASPEKDELVRGLLTLFKYTLLPAESFFHTVLRNSVHCFSYIDNNLHITNWKRSLGCKCQYRHVVDWCGCSPNDFRSSDYSRLVATKGKQLYFARKFEPVVNQDIVNRLDQWLYGAYPANLSGLQSYWENIYHHSDLSPPPDDALVSLGTSLARINVRFNLKSCHLVEPSSNAADSGHRRANSERSWADTGNNRVDTGSNRADTNNNDNDNNRAETGINRSDNQINRADYGNNQADSGNSRADTSNNRSNWADNDINGADTNNNRANTDNYRADTSAASGKWMALGLYSQPERVGLPCQHLEHLEHLEVSSSYDQKEQMSRDFLHAIGPYSEPVLIHEWLTLVTHNITYLWIDPTNVLAAVTRVQVDENTTIDHVKSTLKTPLLPGEWRVKLIWNSQVYLETGFLVVPLEFLNKTPLTQQQAGFVHGGSYPYNTGTKDFTKEWTRFLDPKPHESLERKAALNSRRFGFDLQQWIDSLVSR